MAKIFISIAFLLQLCTTIQGLFPCSQYYSYTSKPGTNNEILGQIKIPSPPKNARYNLRVGFSTNPLIHKNEPVVRLEIEQPVEEANQTVEQDRPLLYHVHFPLGQAIPRLTKIWFNNEQLCPNSAETGKFTTTVVCVDNGWYQPPSCLKVCPPLNSTSVDISCSYQGKTVSCSERIMPGTRATLACKSSYKLTPDPAYREITCFDDGLWDPRLFHCLPECGTAIARGNPLIVNGIQAKEGVFPWHVGIYAKEDAGDKYQQICGGTLISNNLVVSAAHCFYDNNYNASKYAVAVGKHYRDWNAREEYAQNSSVESIKAGRRYQGATGNFANDIALLKLKTPFELTTLVRPVCIDWDNTYEREQLQVGHAGKVVGWGKDITGEPTKSLQEIDMPFVPYEECLSAVPVDFQGYLTPDKFCAGHSNGSSVCDGDSGGGLCFEKDGIWYLRGVVSVSPVTHDRSNWSCDYNSYVGFTSIGHYRDWVREAYVNL